MNVWIFNHYADPPDRLSTRTYDLSRKLVERGHNVTIFAAGFSHYNFEERLGPNEKYREENWSGVRFIWIRTFPYKNNDWRRALNMLSYAWRGLLKSRQVAAPPDAIVGVSVHPLAALTAWGVSKMRGGRFYFELTDLWPEVLIDFGRLSPRSPVTWVLRKLEKFLYHKAKKIIMIWPRTAQYVARYKVPAEKIVWIPHLADLERYRNLKPYDGTVKETFTIMYLGSFNDSTGMWVIPEAAKLLQDRGLCKVCFVLVGGGTTKDALIKSCTHLGVQNVFFHGLVPKKDIAQVMSSADAFLVTLKNVPLLRYGISLNKACDYLASGRPTIFAGTPAYDPIKEAHAGISVSAEDPKALADGVEALMMLSSQERIQMGKNGREYLEKVHGLDVLSRRLEKALEDVADRSIESETSFAMTEHKMGI